MRVTNLKKTRTLCIICLAAFSILASILIAPVTKSFSAESEEASLAKLLEGAKKEGKLLWYTTIPITEAQKFTKRFQEKYPFIETGIFRIGGEKMITKILAEYSANKHLWDVGTTAALNAEVLKLKGLLAKYPSSHEKFYPAGCKDREGYWTAMSFSANVIAYNTRLVSPGEAPKTWDDLLEPRWKGKIGMDTKAFYWFAAMLKIMGEKKGLEYMKKLAAQNIQFRDGKILITQLLAAGELSIQLPVYASEIEPMRAVGAPMEWVPLDPLHIIPQYNPIYISANAPHPNAARLFIDFILSKEGQQMIASLYRVPTRIDVDPLVLRLKKGLTILPHDFSIINDYERYAKLYREVLIKK